MIDAKANIDDAIFFVSPQSLLDGIRIMGGGERAGNQVGELLARVGLANDDGLTDAGRALFKTAWVLQRHDEALKSLGLALRVLTPI